MVHVGYAQLRATTRNCNPVAKSGSPSLLAGPDKGEPVVIEPASIKNPEGYQVRYRAKLAR